MELIINLLLLVAGFAMLVKGADWFVDGAAGIAGKLKIPQLVIGLTIVAMGTSAPEAAVSITSALQGNAGITIGNVVGSNILNVLIILGLASTIVSIAVAKSTVKYEIPFVIGITALLFVLGCTGNAITFIEGVILWAAFIVYLVYLFMMAKNNDEEVEDAVKDKSWAILAVSTIIGAALIVFGSDVTVDAATKIATILGMSERFIGLTVVALGTSLPELVTSVTAARKGNADIAIGNIVGSNIFNILFVVGTTALITTIPFAPNFRIDTIIAALACVVLWVGCRKEHKLTRNVGIAMLLGYVAYFAYLVMI